MPFYTTQVALRSFLRIELVSADRLGNTKSNSQHVARSRHRANTCLECTCLKRHPLLESECKLKTKAKTNWCITNIYNRSTGLLVNAIALVVFLLD